MENSLSTTQRFTLAQVRECLRILAERMGVAEFARRTG
jgi:hypothetical protein